VKCPGWNSVDVLEKRVIERHDEGVFDEFGSYLESDYAQTHGEHKHYISLNSLALSSLVWMIFLVCFLA
jgi:hypothetical protein